jgi:UDP-glucose-4-epimerase GalE
MKSILVTGGAGYIGSHASKALAKAGYYPVVLDNLSTGHRWAVQWGPLIEGDIGDRGLVKRVLRQYRIEAVMHFAANALVGESMQSPFKYLHHNVTSSLQLLEAMRETDVRSIIFSSTCAVYGSPEQLPIIETAAERPVNPYGDSKLYIERALGWYERAHDFSWCALRYFNAAGADPEGAIGEDHDPETHVIACVIQAALEEAGEFTVMGTDYETPDGTAIRDFVHVEDLAGAHVKALRYLLNGGESRVFNLGSGSGSSVLEVVSAVERVGGRRVPVCYGRRRPGDPPVLVAQADQARDHLGWKPQYPDLQAIIRTAWEWHASRAGSSMAAVV